MNTVLDDPRDADLGSRALPDGFEECALCGREREASDVRAELVPGTGLVLACGTCARDLPGGEL